MDGGGDLPYSVPMPPRALSPSDLTACRIAYEREGATFAALASQHHVAERTMRRMLVAVGVEPRIPGRRARELPAELIVADHDDGMSARQIAAKHGLADHHAVIRLLRSHGRQPHHRGRSRGNRAIVLGAAVTDLQARLRRRPPMVIPIRTPAERCSRWFTAPELEAIEQAVAAGRVQRVHRGARGLPEVVGWQEARARAWWLFHGRQAA